MCDSNNQLRESTPPGYEIYYTCIFYFDLRFVFRTNTTMAQKRSGWTNILNLNSNQCVILRC